MGWKTLKERFGIGHIVQVTSAGIVIGSGYVSDLVTINPATGKVTENSTFSGFLREHCPVLLSASADEILAAINAEDTFATSSPVYTYQGGTIIEKFCENPGYPNVTHDGCLMYENTYSTDRSMVVWWARRNAEAGISIITRHIADTEKRLAEQRDDLAACSRDLEELKAAYPDLVVAD